MADRDLSNSLLRSLGEKGWIPAPGEDRLNFLQRVHILQHLESFPMQILKEEELQNFFTKAKQIQWQKLCANMKEKIGCLPHWILAFYSNHQLLPWQGAASIIYTHRTGVKIPIIQLNKRFSKGKYLGYNREDVLLHEVLHAIRSAYPESRFEELFAYYTCRKKWHRIIGPLFRTPKQVGFFLFTLVLSLGSQIGNIFFSSMKMHIASTFLLFSPFIYLCFLILFLFCDRYTFKKTLRKLKKIFPNSSSSFPIALRLTDKEMYFFARYSEEKIYEYIHCRYKDSLRWQQILLQFSLAKKL